MSKMNDYVIDLHEKGLISLDTNGDYIMNNDHFPPQPEPVEEKPAFKIEKGIPMPASLRHKDRWTHLPFDKMEVGDSFVVDDMHSKEDETSLRGRATRENNRDDGKFFSVVKNPDLANSMRVFRIQ
jgi:hypothetical protein|tara:strand:+ start:213 stop:590 length:378 start_codon:yes stop_codon:yes gene_type:complete